MKILIYDDNIDDVKQLGHCIKNFFSKLSEDYTITYCQPQDELF